MTPDISTILQVGGTVFALVAFGIGIKYRLQNLEDRRKEDREFDINQVKESREERKAQILDLHNQILNLRHDMEARMNLAESRSGTLEVRLGRGEEKFDGIEKALFEIKTDIRILLSRRRKDREQSEEENED